MAIALLVFILVLAVAALARRAATRGSTTWPAGAATSADGRYDGALEDPAQGRFVLGSQYTSTLSPARVHASPRRGSRLPSAEDASDPGALCEWQRVDAAPVRVRARRTVKARTSASSCATGRNGMPSRVASVGIAVPCMATEKRTTT